MPTSTLTRRFSRLLLATAAAATVTSACGTPVAATVIGNPADYAVNVFSGWTQRWNPCAPVHYRVDIRLQPAALGTVKAAVAQLSKGTGISFVFDGTTAYTPTGGSWSQPAPLVISFAKHAGQPGGSSYLAGGNQLGEGGFQSSYQTVNGKITSYKIVKGYAVLDAAAFSRSTPKVRTGSLLHELGHAVGLNHAHFTSEIMYPVISNSGAGAYSSGDLAGLRRVGSAAGCIR